MTQGIEPSKLDIFVEPPKLTMSELQPIMTVSEEAYRDSSEMSELSDFNRELVFRNDDAASPALAMLFQQSPSQEMCESLPISVRQLNENFVVDCDITRQKHSELNLPPMAHACCQCSEGVMVTDAKSRILTVNPTFELITGFSEAEVLFELPRLLVSDRHQSTFHQQLLHRLQYDGYWEGELWSRRKNGEIYSQWLSISRVPRLGQPVLHYVVIFRDNTETKNKQRKIERLAYYDSLTNLANRNLLRDRVEQLIKRHDRFSSEFYLFFIDLDHFKNINDVHGHDIGDQFLQEIALRLRQQFRDTDTLCRLGGDEFIILLPEVTLQHALEKAQHLLLELANPIQVGEIALKVTASLGIVQFPHGGANYSELLKHADFAMYQAKSAGKNQLCMFESSMIFASTRR